MYLQGEEREVIKMMMFLLGMLAMYVICGIIIFMADCIVGTADRWIFGLFCWWIMIPISIVVMIVVFIREIIKIKFGVDK
jgi:hypothetical protein